MINVIPSIMLRGLVVIVCRYPNSLNADDDAFSANNLYSGADLDGGVIWALRFPFVTVYLHIAKVTGTDGFYHSAFAPYKRVGVAQPLLAVMKFSKKRWSYEDDTQY